MFPDKSVSASFLIIDVWQTHVSPVRWANRYIYRDSFFHICHVLMHRLFAVNRRPSFVLSGLRSASWRPMDGPSGCFSPAVRIQHRLCVCSAILQYMSFPARPGCCFERGRCRLCNVSGASYLFFHRRIRGKGSRVPVI